jgi:hypothetical protein
MSGMATREKSRSKNLQGSLEAITSDSTPAICRLNYLNKYLLSFTEDYPEQMDKHKVIEKISF